jgi:hypothetical protein
MAQQAGKVYASAEEMVAGVSKETGVSAEEVRKVIRASFASTKDFILKQLAEAESAKPGTAKKGAAVSDKDLDAAAGGIIIVGGTPASYVQKSPGLGAFSQRYGVNPAVISKIGALGP